MSTQSVSSVSSLSLSGLPSDVLECIVLRLDTLSHDACRRTCRTMKELCRTNMNVQVACDWVPHKPELFFDPLTRQKLKCDETVRLAAAVGECFKAVGPNGLYKNDVFQKNVRNAVCTIEKVDTSPFIPANMDQIVNLFFSQLQQIVRAGKRKQKLECGCVPIQKEECEYLSRSTIQDVLRTTIQIYRTRVEAPRIFSFQRRLILTY